MAEEFVYEIREKTTSVTVREFTPQGVRISFNLQGQVKGQYDAARMETVDALLKPDGTYDLELRIVDQTAAGEVILIPGTGTGTFTSPTTARIGGTNTFRTASKTFAWLNTAKGRWEGTYHAPTGEVVVKCYAER